MKNKYRLKHSLAWKIMLAVLFWITVQNSNAQSGISLSWDKEVGCQENIRINKWDIEDIEDTECIRVCEYSLVTYTINNLPTGSTTTWNVSGGTIVGQTANSRTIQWSALGLANLSFSITYNNSIITKSICIEKVATPEVYFEVVSYSNVQDINSCIDQVLYFNNFSAPNMTYHWDFGDGTTSAEFEPSHTYTYNDNFHVVLIVTNDCNCSSAFQMNINVGNRGFDISCPGVVCENQSQIYSLPFDGAQICQNNFDWSVEGGQILSQSDGNVEVLWNHIDQNGFGYVTFNPQYCDVECPEPTTIKIPVIQTHGTIQGPSAMCLGKQGVFSLPQWPSTDFQWEIIGNENEDLADVFTTDQRNEIVVKPLVSGTLTLRVTYMNTLLKCGGQAEFQITISEPLAIVGNNAVCQYSSTSFSTSQNAIASWILKRSNGTTETTLTNQNFTYDFPDAGDYILTAYANGFCQAQKAISVTAQPPAPLAIFGEASICPNTPIAYTISNPNPNYNYVWAVSSGGTIVGSHTGTSVNITFQGPFPVTVSAVAETVAPIVCQSTATSISVTKKVVKAEILNEDPYNTSYTVCANSTAIYNVIDPGLGNLHSTGDAYTWSLSNPDLGSIISGQGTHTVSVLWNHVTTTQTVDLVLTINKCTLNPAPQFIKTITIVPTPQIEIVPSVTTICGGSNYEVDFEVKGLNNVTLAPGTVVIWNFGGADITDDVYFTKSFTNNTNQINHQTVTAYIVNANGCGATNIASVIIDVLPNPPAIASLSSSGGNAFCGVQNINATLQVASNNTDLTAIQWLYNGSAISGATGNTLVINGSTPYGFGQYQFIAYRESTQCYALSNTINIVEICANTGPCSINETVTNTSYLSNCNTITFQGSYSGNPVSDTWHVFGPGTNNYTITGNQLTGNPGMYHIIHKVGYNCPEGEIGYYNIVEQVVIPYKPDFSYSTVCNSNNTFDVTFFDNSVIYSEVTNPTVQLMYSLTSNYPSGLQPISNLELNGLAPGNYTFELSINGYYEGVLYPTCKKTLTVNLQGLNPNLEIVLLKEADCHDTAVEFGFNFQLPGCAFFWTFENGVNNTNATPSRVFNQSGSFNVTVEITTPLGCIVTLSKAVEIPDPCFDGDIISDPSPAEVCQNHYIRLKYQPGNDNCEATSFIWMNNDQAISAQTPNNHIDVSLPGNYWVKVFSENNCEYHTPSRISPLFKIPPTAKIVGPTSFCESENGISLQAVTNATTLNWTLNGVLSTDNQDNPNPLFIYPLLYGGQVNTIQLEAILDGCSRIVTHQFIITELVNYIDIATSVSCNPYQVTLTATASNGNPVTYHWSNGVTQTGNSSTITVLEGGAYRVTAVLGNCSTSAQIDVPKNPENYLWVFPKGCFADCDTDLNQLIGPSVTFGEWSWEFDNQIQNAGNDSVPEDFFFNNPGSYTMSIANGGCTVTSEPLQYQTVSCDGCPTSKPFLKSISVNSTPYCSNTVELEILNVAGTPYQATISNTSNNAIITPASFTIDPNSTLYTFTIIPTDPIIGGTTDWLLQGNLPGGENGYTLCQLDFSLTTYECEENNEFSKTALAETEVGEGLEHQVNLFPNPAKESVAVKYSLSTTATITLYDLTGRALAEHSTSTVSGEWNVTTGVYPAGIYLVVIKQTDGKIWQQKLVIE